MAKIVHPPCVSGQDQHYVELSDKYFDKVAAMVHADAAAGEHAGEVIRFAYADGYAQYMVVSAEPPVLMHLKHGDAWRLQEFMEKGIDADVIRKEVKRERLLDLLFGRNQ